MTELWIYTIIALVDVSKVHITSNTKRIEFGLILAETEFACESMTSSLLFFRAMFFSSVLLAFCHSSERIL